MRGVSTAAIAAVNPGETLPQAVARRLRGQLAELRITQLQLGALTGWGRMYIGRRLSGETPIDTADLEHIEQTVGVSVAYLVTGQPPPLIGGAASPNPLRRRMIKGSQRIRADKPVDWLVTPNLAALKLAA